MQIFKLTKTTIFYEKGYYKYMRCILSYNYGGTLSSASVVQAIFSFPENQFL